MKRRTFGEICPAAVTPHQEHGHGVTGQNGAATGWRTDFQAHPALPIERTHEASEPDLGRDAPNRPATATKGSRAAPTGAQPRAGARGCPPRRGARARARPARELRRDGRARAAQAARDERGLRDADRRAHRPRARPATHGATSTRSIRVSSRVRSLVEALLPDAREQPAAAPGAGRHGQAAARLPADARPRRSELRDARIEIDPMPVVEGDPALLSGVFSNLLSNALKYGPRDGGEIRISAERPEAGWTFASRARGRRSREGRQRHLRAVAARPERAPRPGRRPRPGDRAPDRRAPRRHGRRHVADRRPTASTSRCRPERPAAAVGGSLRIRCGDRDGLDA